MADILVIIVTFNGLHWMDRCIGSVRSSSVPADIFVVDNGSTDGTPEWLREHGIEPVLRPDNPGFGTANNIGLKYAVENGYKYVYLLNQDAWVAPDTFAKLLDSFNGGFGILSPLQKDGGGIDLDANFSRKCGKALRRSDANPAEVDFVMAAHWMISRDCLLATGAFSPVFRHYGEDLNYIDRARFHGFKAGVVRDAEAVHDRKQRESTKERRMWGKYPTALAQLSNPRGCFCLRAVWVPLELVLMSIRNFSITPLKHIPKLMKRYPEIKQARSISKGTGAFL